MVFSIHSAKDILKELPIPASTLKSLTQTNGKFYYTNLEKQAQIPCVAIQEDDPFETLIQSFQHDSSVFLLNNTG